MDDDDGTASELLDPTDDVHPDSGQGQASCPITDFDPNDDHKPCEGGLFPCQEDGDCPYPLGANTRELIYVNPGGFKGRPEEDLELDLPRPAATPVSKLPTANAIRWVMCA